VVAPVDVAVVEGSPALVSPWIEGVDLLDWIEVLRERNVPLPGRVVCEIAKSAAQALEASLHRRVWGEREALGVQHRDVKPANVMISRDGQVKVVDFASGLTTLGGREGRSRAMSAGVGRYLSPGRRQGKRGGPHSDVYALGLILIELFSGRWIQRVRDDNPAHDRLLAEVVAEIPDLGLRSPQDDRTLRSLLLRMVAHDGEARPLVAEVAQTMRALADRAPAASLESFAHDHPLGWIEPPDPQDGLPEGRVVDPAALPALVDLDPDEPATPTFPPPDPDPDEDEDEDEVYTPARFARRAPRPAHDLEEPALPSSLPATEVLIRPRAHAPEPVDDPDSEISEISPIVRSPADFGLARADVVVEHTTMMARPSGPAPAPPPPAVAPPPSASVEAAHRRTSPALPMLAAVTGAGLAGLAVALGLGIVIGVGLVLLLL
jgi:serine/threonine protein kinase